MAEPYSYPGPQWGYPGPLVNLSSLDRNSKSKFVL